MKQLALALEDAPRRARTAALRSAHFRSHVEPAEALAIEAAAQRQEDILLQWFQVNQTARVTPSELHAIFSQWPITSLRRALTNLSSGDEPRLVHYGTERRVGPWGVKESCWGLA